MRNLMVTFQYVSEPSLETTRFLTGRSNCLHIKKGNKMKKKKMKKKVYDKYICATPLGLKGVQIEVAHLFGLVPYLEPGRG